MIINKIFITISICISMTGCTYNLQLLDSIIDLNQPHRVIEHNFDKKYNLVYKENNTITFVNNDKKITYKNTKLFKKNKNNKVKSSLTYVDIDFLNESTTIKNHDEIVKKIKYSINSDKYIIVGNSHGKSSIGVESLASKRARYLSNILFLSGTPRENIFYMSSWSDGGQPYNISKGARVIGLPKNYNEDLSLVTGLILGDNYL